MNRFTNFARIVAVSSLALLAMGSFALAAPAANDKGKSDEDQTKATYDRFKRDIDAFTSQWRTDLNGLKRDMPPSEVDSRSSKLFRKLIHFEGACTTKADAVKIAQYLKEAAERQGITTGTPSASTLATYKIDANLFNCANHRLDGFFYVYDVKFAAGALAGIAAGQKPSDEDQTKATYDRFKRDIDAFTGQWRTDLNGLKRDMPPPEVDSRSSKLFQKLIHFEGACTTKADAVKIAQYLKEAAERQGITTGTPSASTLATYKIDANLFNCANHRLDGFFYVYDVKFAAGALAEPKGQKSGGEELTKANTDRIKNEITSFMGQWRRGIDDLNGKVSSNDLSSRSNDLLKKLVHFDGACQTKDDGLRLLQYFKDSAERQGIITDDPKASTFATYKIDATSVSCDNNHLAGGFVIHKVTVIHR